MGIRTSLHTEGQSVDLNHRQPGFLCFPCTIRTRIPVVCTFQFRLLRYYAPLRRFGCAWLPYKHSCPGMLRFSVLSLLLTADGGRSSFSRMISPVLTSRYEQIFLIFLGLTQEEEFLLSIQDPIHVHPCFVYAFCWDSHV